MNYGRLIVLAALAASAGIVYQQVQRLIAPQPLPDIDVHRHWGSAPASTDKPNDATVLMEIRYQDKPIDDLRELLATATDALPKLLGDGEFESAFSAEFVREFVTYWRDDYLMRWRSREVLLNRMPQFKTNIQGLELHYIHTRATYDIGNKTRLPILLLHAAPGTMRDFYDLAAHLADPHSDRLGDVVFDVVAPSLPGCAWSEAAPPHRRVELDVVAVAVMVRNLMQRLGYERYYVHGDGAEVGGRVAAAVATLFADEVIGVHSSGCAVRTPLALGKAAVEGWLPEGRKEEEVGVRLPFILSQWTGVLREAVRDVLRLGAIEDTPAPTKRTTLDWALRVFDQYARHTHPDFRHLADGGWSRLSDDYRDAIMDTITIYRLTGSFARALRPLPDRQRIDAVPTSVPMSCSRFHQQSGSEPLASDWQLRDKFTGLLLSVDHREGGGFAALQRAETVFEDVARLVRTVRETEKKVEKSKEK